MADYWLSEDRASPVPPEEIVANASYWESESSANVVYSTGKSPAKLTNHKPDSKLKPKDPRQKPRPDKTSTNEPETSAPLQKPDDKTRDPRQSRDPRDPRRRSGALDKYSSKGIESHERVPPPERPDKITKQNIERHRLLHETNPEWDLRRAFLLQHYQSIPRDQLECLSQVLVNVQFHGARYPDEVMRRVDDLSSHIAEQVQSVKRRQREKMEIKFVKSDEHSIEPTKKSPVSGLAGRKRPHGTETSLKDKPVAFVRPNTEDASLAMKTEKPVDTTKTDSSEESKTEVEDTTEDEEPSVKKIKKGKDKSPVKATVKMEEYRKNKKLYATSKTEELMYDLAYAVAQGEVEERKRALNAIEEVYVAATRVPATIEISTNSQKKVQFCTVLASNIVLGEAEAANKKLAKHAAFEKTLEKLQKPFLRVVRVNPEKQELQASSKPFNDGQSSTSGLAVLGGREVARRGMKTHKQDSKIADFVIVDHSNKSQVSNAANVLRQSADFNRVELQFDFEETEKQVVCRIYLDHEELVFYTAPTKQLAKINAAEQALEKLQKSNWTLKIKGSADTNVSGLSRDEVLGDLSKASDAIADDNIGSKLLKKMGWTGGGVGKTGQGIAEPVKADTTLVRREGFGLSSSRGLPREFKSNIINVLRDYCRSQRQDDLCFEPEFSNEERAIVHLEARKMGLKSRSYGKGDDRYLVVGRKRSCGELFQHIMAQGGATSKYELVAPTGGQNTD